MSLSARHPSTLIRPPAERHVRAMEQFYVQLDRTIKTCSQDSLRVLLVVEEDSLADKWTRAHYLPVHRCKVSAIMAVGPEEHEAIEILNAVQDYDLQKEIPVIIHDPQTLDRIFSFVVWKATDVLIS
ncbi:MAG: hypothetical protein JST12_08960 [Armatimonadetes bacterium]|nr:hypothetical protein [Armatimonadota bacterium]